MTFGLEARLSIYVRYPRDLRRYDGPSRMPLSQFQSLRQLFQRRGRERAKNYQDNSGEYATEEKRHLGELKLSMLPD